METKQKRDQIIEELKEALAKDGMSISYSSPKVKYFYLSKKEFPTGIAPEEDATPEAAQAFGENAEEDAFGAPTDAGAQEAEDEIDYENLSPKEYKKLKKEKEKEEKRLLQIRKDAHKRGYDTSVLRQFDDPEELYDLSDKEIDQMQAVGYINEDGFYDFVFPPDAKDIKREGLSGKRIALIMLVAMVGGGMLVWLFSSFSSIF